MAASVGASTNGEENGDYLAIHQINRALCHKNKAKYELALDSPLHQRIVGNQAFSTLSTTPEYTQLLAAMRDEVGSQLSIRRLRFRLGTW